MDPTDGAPGPAEPLVGPPPPKPAKPRILQDGRDMFWSLVPLVVMCVLLAGLVGMCSFGGRGPTEGPTPTYDAAVALKADAAAVDFGVRLPKLPDGWQANSGTRTGIESGRTVDRNDKRRAIATRVGYIAPSKMYVSLTQSNADEAALVRSIQKDVYPTGAENVDGVTWVVYQGAEGSEPVWTTRLDSAKGPTQVAISGSGSPDDFRALAIATQTQPPLG
jgi:hypothetical protein